MEISFPVLSSTHAPLFCVCALWHLVNPTAVSALSGEGMGSFYRVMRGVPTRKLPGISCQERLPSHGKSKPAVEASCVSEALFHPVLDYAVLSLETLIPIYNGQTDVFGVLPWD